jgi:dihydrofolate reductase
MNAIVCVSRNWGIGKDNSLLFHIPEDLKRFRALTTGKVVVMGHNTLLSLPDGKPLPDRVNIVMSHNAGLYIPGAKVIGSVQDLMIEVSQYGGEDVFVIGGESVYRMLLPQCRRAYVTRVDACPEADSFFPDLEAAPNWKIERESELFDRGGVGYSFVDYVNDCL